MADLAKLVDELSALTVLEAAELANHASGIVVGKLGTATVSLEELEASIVSTPFER